MAGKRHHTCPRFLLKGFASSTRKREIYTWMYRKGAGGIELNIGNVGVERDFYGREDESELDERITADEGQYARLLDDLRSRDCVDPRVIDQNIPNLIAHLCLRTRQFRQSATSAFDFGLKGIQDHLTQADVFRTIVQTGIGPDGDIRKGLVARLVASGMRSEQAEDAIEQLFATPGVLDELIRDCLPQTLASMNEFVNTYRSMLPQVTRAAFINSLSRSLKPEQRIEVYRKYNWFLIEVGSPLLLGDSACVFETSGTRRFKTLDDHDDDVRRVFLPISSNRLLVGAPTPYKPEIDLRVLNKAIARCSHEFFVSSKCLRAPDDCLSKMIGQWSGILSNRELNTLMDGVRKEWPKAN